MNKKTKTNKTTEKLDQLREALITGEKSGEATEFDFEAFKARKQKEVSEK